MRAHGMVSHTEQKFSLCMRFLSEKSQLVGMNFLSSLNSKTRKIPLPSFARAKVF